jgi:acetyl-CoA carboxylase carboxyl transferase subunit alpha
MLEHAVYSVISPEGCASILWRDPGRAEEAAMAMKITAPDLLAFGIVDEVVPEPPEGAHASPETLFKTLGDLMEAQLAALTAIPIETLLQQRYEKFRRMGRLGKEYLERTE